MKKMSEKSIERLVLYRRIVLQLKQQGRDNLYSHELARFSGSSPAKVRRDLMSIGYSGTPAHGYQIDNLLRSLNEFLDKNRKEAIAIVGMGNLGRAVAGYIRGRRPNLEIGALFDKNPKLTDRLILGVRCYPIDQFKQVCEEQGIRVAIIAVPGDQAQMVADTMVSAGISGILNYAPMKLQLPQNIYVEDRDMILAVEKVAFFSGNQ